MSDDFDGPGAAEKASIEGDLNGCRARAPQIASELRNEGLEHFADNCRWRTFAPPLSTLPMSSDRKPDGRSRTHLLPW
jgi:hypothetical protein